MYKAGPLGLSAELPVFIDGTFCICRNEPKQKAATAAACRDELVILVSFNHKPNLCAFGSCGLGAET